MQLSSFFRSWSRRIARACPAPLGVPLSAWLVVAAFFALALYVALRMHFPTRVDELQHYSVIRSQYEQPTLFPDWSRYLTLRWNDLTQWTGRPNYINHPSLYYLLLAPLMALGSHPLPFRLVNVLMATAALAIVVVAARRRFSDRVVPPTLFAVFAASFPKAALVGGMVNNDNLAGLAAAALFAGLTGMPGQAWWILAALAIAGWTKLTAFIGLAAVAGVWLGLRLWRGELGWRHPLFLYVAAGLLIGALPYLVTYARIGQPIWVNEAVWRVPVGRRAHFDLGGFTRYFFRQLVRKWPASEGVYPFWLALLGLLTPLVLAVLGTARRAVRLPALAYLAALLFLLGTHFLFGWRSFQALGDLTIMQTRYYNILWPGIALAATAAAAGLSRYWRPAGWIAAALCVTPTLLGGLARIML